MIMTFPKIRRKFMQENRRSFLKKATVAGSLAAIGAVSATASSTQSTFSSNGVVVGNSPKKEITYKKTKAWDDYYRSAL
jgi:hypothetical protein